MIYFNGCLFTASIVTANAIAAVDAAADVATAAASVVIVVLPAYEMMELHLL